MFLHNVIDVPKRLSGRGGSAHVALVWTSVGKTPVHDRVFASKHCWFLVACLDEMHQLSLRQFCFDNCELHLGNCYDQNANQNANLYPD